MHYVLRKYGKIVEITEIEKEPSCVRVYVAPKRRVVCGPRRADNLRRTRQICVRRLLSAIACFGSPLLFTLTFEGCATDAAYASDCLKRFQLRLRTYFKECQSLFVPELSPRGRIHFHGLIFGVPLRYGDSYAGRRLLSVGEERSTRIFADLWGCGYVDCRTTDGSDRLAYYLSKYITKAGGEVLFNAMRMIRISHGFPKEDVLRGDDAMYASEILREWYDPFSEWSGDNIFLGHMERRKYEV